MNWQESKKIYEDLNSKDKIRYNMLFLKYCRSGMDGHNAHMSAVDELIKIKNNMKKCNASNSTGYWRGYQCGNEGKYEHDGKHYCYAHIKKAELGEYDNINWDKE